MKFYFSALEIKEILIATIVLSVSFAIAFSDGILRVNTDTLPFMIILSFVVVGVGFLAHELIGHKYFAQRYDMHAEFRFWRMGLVIAFLSSLVGFVFAAPGAVYIGQKLDMWGNPIPNVSRKQMGITSVMGPVVNVVLALIFIILNYLNPIEILSIPVFSFGATINIWLALFNMLPIPPLDGSKVFAWDRRVFVGLFAVIIAMYLLV